MLRNEENMRKEFFSDGYFFKELVNLEYLPPVEDEGGGDRWQMTCCRPDDGVRIASYESEE